MAPGSFLYDFDSVVPKAIAQSMKFFSSAASISIIFWRFSALPREVDDYFISAAKRVLWTPFFGRFGRSLSCEGVIHSCMRSCNRIMISTSSSSSFLRNTVWFKAIALFLLTHAIFWFWLLFCVQLCAWPIIGAAPSHLRLCCMHTWHSLECWHEVVLPLYWSHFSAVSSRHVVQYCAFASCYAFF